MMRRAVCLLAVLATVATVAQDVDVLDVTGRGAEGRPVYDAGGEVRFLRASVGGQVLHYDGGDALVMPLAIDYDVLEPAPIALSSSMGTEFWRLYNFADETMSALYTREDIDLSEPGEHTAAPEDLRGWFGPDKYGPKPARGLVGIRGHYYFLIAPAGGGPWIDITSPPPWFDSQQVARSLTFTLADLTSYTVQVEEFQSTWEAGGPLRVRVTVTDAQGDTLPVVNVPLKVTAGAWEMPLETEWGLLSEPTGWMRATLPEELPDEIAVAGQVAVVTPDGPAWPEINETYARGEGQVAAAEMQVAQQGYELPRNADGVIRETRAIWASPSDMESAEKIDLLVERCSEAGLNAILADIFVRNNFMAKSALMPWTEEKWAEFDPLAYLVEGAHAAGIEVHPWFCTTYRDRQFRAWFEQQFGRNVDLVGEDGSVESLPADAHRPEYRDFMVALMVGIARDYDVDGIHHDYIRVMKDCYCADCRAEFEAQFDVPLTEATDEQWTAWHREAIGDIVQRTAEGVREVNPDAILTAAVFSNLASGARQGQDSAEWARQGWLDVVIPMDYAMQSLQVRANEREFLEALDDDDMLVTGLSLYQRAGTAVSSRPPELVLEQIDLVRAMGIRGYCLFAFSHLSDEQLAVLRDEVNAEKAVPFYR